MTELKSILVGIVEVALCIFLNMYTFCLNSYLLFCFYNFVISYVKDIEVYN